MLLIEIRRPHRFHWNGLYTHSVAIMDDTDGWYRPLFFKDPGAVIGVINAAIDAAILLGHPVHHVIIRED